MKEHKNKIFLVLICVFFISLGLTIAVAFSNQQEPSMLIKAVIPAYDEESTVVVSDNGVVFNDKNQEVKYKVVIENPNNYDVKVSDIVLSTPSEDFLEYEVENLDKDDVINANGTKELVVSFNTVKKEGWGRNFSDELTANISFAKVTKLEELKPTPEPEVDKEEDKKEEIKEETKEESKVEKEPIVDEPSQKEEMEQEIVVPDDDLVNNVEGNKKEDNVKVDSKADLNVDSKDKKSNNALIIILGSITVVSGLIIIIIIVKDKKKKTAALMFVLLSGITLVNAEELIKLPLTFKVSFESQNVMKPSGWKIGPEGNIEAIGTSMWQYIPQVINVYIENEFREIENPVYELDVSKDDKERVKAYFVKNEEKQYCTDAEENDVECLDLYLQADGIIYANENASFYFASAFDLENIVNLEGLDTSKVVNMEYMFAATGSRVENLDLDLSSLDTSNVTNMRNMFFAYGTTSKKLALDLSNWNSEKVTDMSYMFYQMGGYSEEIDINLNSFDTDSVTDMSYMFASTFLYSEKVNLDLSSFNTSNVENMTNMFYQCGGRAQEFSLNLKSFDTSKVTDMSYMFSSVAYESENGFILDISSFDTGNVTNMAAMFYHTGHEGEAFSLVLGDKFDTSKVLHMDEMFQGMGNKSLVLNVSITIRNPNMESYSSMFINTAVKDGAKITINYIPETEGIVDSMISSLPNSVNVVKGKLIVDVEKLSIGDEIHIAGEKFNVISQTDDTITMLAKYNIGPDYKQSKTANDVYFSNTVGWEYTPGPKEIDIQIWSVDPKNYVNYYVDYLRTKITDKALYADLITLKQLEALECKIPENYGDGPDKNCYDSSYAEWLINGQSWWTKSAQANSFDLVWNVSTTGYLSQHGSMFTHGVRPVITISKETLRNMK